jgi:hypothetical protein
MRALSLTQPWAWLVVHGGKDIENRRWNTRLRGQFLIHASKSIKEDDYESAFEAAMLVGGLDLADSIPNPDRLERGGIVGVAELVGVVHPYEEAMFIKRRVPWHLADQFGFRLRNVHPLPFLPCKGALGFWGNFAIVNGKAVQL